MKIFTKIENEWNETQYKGDLWNKWNIKSFDKFLEFLKLQAGGFFFQFCEVGGVVIVYRKT